MSVRVDDEQDAAGWIDALALEAHPAGGFFRQYYRAPFPGAAERPLITVIYCLLTRERPRAGLHRLTADSLYFHHAGGTLRIVSVGAAGDLCEARLGPPDGFQAEVAGGRWKGLELVSGPWALISEAVVPGWTPADHEVADRSLQATVTPALWSELAPFVGGGA